MTADESPHTTVRQLVEAVAEFDEQPFWKQVVVLSCGLLYLGLTRVILPLLLVVVAVEVLPI